MKEEEEILKAMDDEMLQTTYRYMRERVELLLQELLTRELPI